MEKIKFKAIRKVKSPERESRNAGYDLFVPEFDEDFVRKLVMDNITYFRLTNHDMLTTEEIIKDIVDKGYLNIEPVDYIESGITHAENHFNIKIPSGLLYSMEDSNDDNYTYDFKITNKSGVASKYSLITGACVCDMTYRDEVLINIIGFKPFTLKPNFKLAQGIIRRVEIPKIEFIPFGDDTELFDETTDNRGGGFGITGDGLTQI